jgi:hypothetical protein
MQMRKLLVLLLLLPSPAFAAIAGTAQWDVRTTGNDANGGAFDPSVAIPGTDYSQQNSAQVAFTDLVIGGTTTQVTSAANPFATCTAGVGYCGNLINITGGAGCTTGWYEVLSTSTITATLDRSAGTAASVCTGNLGGSLLTIQQANTNSVTQNTINIQSGTYTFTSTMTVLQPYITFIGYGTTHGDNGTRPLITTATNSTDLFYTTNSGTGVQTWQNISFSNTATTRGTGINQHTADGAMQWWVLKNDIFDGFTKTIDSDNAGATFYVCHIAIIGTEIKNAQTFGVRMSLSGGCTGQSLLIYGSYFHGNSQDVSLIQAGTQTSAQVVGNIFAGASGSSSSVNFNTIESVTVVANTFYGAATNALTLTIGTSVNCVIQNNIFYGNNGAIGGGSVTAPNSNVANLIAANNAYGSTDTNSNFADNASKITLSTSPFVNAASGNFALNSTAGGGVLLAGKGFPQVYGTTTLSTPSVGAVQGSSGITVPVGNFGFSN